MNRPSPVGSGRVFRVDCNNARTATAVRTAVAVLADARLCSRALWVSYRFPLSSRSSPRRKRGARTHTILIANVRFPPPSSQQQESRHGQRQPQRDQKQSRRQANKNQQHTCEYEENARKPLPLPSASAHAHPPSHASYAIARSFLPKERTRACRPGSCKHPSFTS